MRVTVNKSSVTNIGDYSNVSPNAELTIDNVKTEDFWKVHNYLQNIVNAMFDLNMLNTLNDTVPLVYARKDIVEYNEHLRKGERSLLEQIDININGLKQLGYEV
ncbi:MAG: hypothetical protein ACOC80_16565 [Petrotogales bacterium]